MGGRIDCYIDIVSFYSFLAFAHLIENLSTLEAHGVQVEFHPVLLAAINNKSGNKPPWMLPARANYLVNYETPRAKAQFKHPDIRPPNDLMAVGLTILPLRCLHYVKKTYPRETYHALLAHLYRKFWCPPNENLTRPDVLRQALVDANLFSSSGEDEDDECAAILAAAGTQESKDALARTTDEALAKGAYGAPWLWVTNGEGKAEPFFGSDRFHHIWKYLGLPYQEVALLPPGEKSKPKL